MANTEPSLADARVVLDITADATRAQVGSAFRRLARAVHPDVNEHHDAAPRFDALVTAYRIALQGAAGEGRSTDTSESSEAAEGGTPPATGPSGRPAHEVVVGTSGTTVWEAGRPVLFVSAVAHAPSGRARPRRRGGGT